MIKSRKVETNYEIIDDNCEETAKLAMQWWQEMDYVERGRYANNYYGKSRKLIVKKDIIRMFKDEKTKTLSKAVENANSELKEFFIALGRVFYLDKVVEFISKILTKKPK